MQISEEDKELISNVDEFVKEVITEFGLDEVEDVKEMIDKWNEFVFRTVYEV